MFLLMLLEIGPVDAMMRNELETFMVRKRQRRKFNSRIEMLNINMESKVNVLGRPD